MYKKLTYLSLFASLSLFANSEIEDLKLRIDSLEAIIQQQQQQQEDTKIRNSLMGSLNSFSQSSYMPDLSLIVDTSYVNRSMKDEELTHLEIPGVAHGIMGSHSHGEHSHAPYNASNGFNLNYAEVAMESVVDPYFRTMAVFHLTEDGFEIEEAYGETTSLGYGLKAKIGKFRSDFGRINEQHQHVQDFSDMPLVYMAFLGEHGINDIGAQVQWTLPTDTYVMVGVEALQGKNPSMYGTDAIIPEGAEEVAVASPSQPNLLVGYIKSSFDLGNTTFLYGGSIAYGDSHINHLDDEEGPHAFVADSYLYGVDLTVKHYFDSYSYLTFQGEYLYRDMDGSKYEYPTDGNGTITDYTTFDVTPTVKKQSGYYAQLVYAYNQNWRAGFRYDAINKNEINGQTTLPQNFDRYSAMIDYTTSEFARIRLQYNRNNAMFNEDGERQHIDTVILQLNLAIGAHGAHNF
ncbi:hypothetical protein [Sulfurimonas marina]|uniref:Zinc-regulated TonB-dependent outer membrane receptor n=1 Tax=Sulfurimonas marina TaxID=2590551 RepID=A0A7M1AVP8_9BACT|nr:hypothetical protein [Sulfurimonas marina]QOP41519.1 hypothetical protein FJR03_07085 [Sulfurimonas marina]